MTDTEAFATDRNIVLWGLHEDRGNALPHAPQCDSQPMRPAETAATEVAATADGSQETAA
ncbi:MAG TPA: hypothetical protein VLX44_11775 [Xanthobacteraceae bacterium]|nr:hypothetical protein [Xanthobacteraceae bacterium]